MKFIQGPNRTQINLFPVSLDQSIDPDYEVRIIDLFVDNLSVKDYGFRTDYVENGRPAYHPTDLLKLFIYGYMNKVRSTRDLEKECHRNIGVMWLLKCLKPDHNTISNFRQDNERPIRKVFRATVQIAKHFDLIGGKLIAGDSTKLRAQNSKKNNFNQAKIDRHIAYIDNKLDEYTRALAESDGDNKKIIQAEIKKQQERKDNYRDLEKQLTSTGNISWFKQYKTKSCRKCPLRSQCTRSKKERLIQRSEYAEYYERNRINIQDKEHFYKRRQAIVEHPYGTIKRQWGFNYILTKKGIARASSDVAFMFIAYNLRRIGNILTLEVLKEYLKAVASMYFDILVLIRGILVACEGIFFPGIQMAFRNRLSLKPL
jgi:transposase